MSVDTSLLKEICEASGAPGFEDRIRDIVRREISSSVDEVKVDNMGNVDAIKRGSSDKSVMIGAHMDEIGFVVTHIDDSGFLRFNTLGGFDPKTLSSQRVIIHGKEDVVGVLGTKPVHLMDEQEKKKPPQLKDFFIDTGRSKAEVEELITVGDPVTRERELVEMGNCVNCKSIDNRVSVYILIEVLRSLGEVPYDIHGVFTVQEEVGLRGARVSAHEIQPDIGFGLDTTVAFDVPGAGAHEKVTALGEGAGIKVLDASAICDPRIVRYLKETADRHGIQWQPEVLTAGGTDTSGIQSMSEGSAITGAVSIPTRHIHQVIEMANKDDISGCIALLKHALQDLGSFDDKRD